MKASLIVSILMTVLFTGAVIWKTRRLPESISAMVFDLSAPCRWTWGVWLWAVSFLTAIPAVETLSARGLEGIAFAMLASLAMTGAIPLFNKDGRRAHYIFAIGGGVLSQVCTLLISPCWLWLWLLMPAIPLADRMWWHQSIPVWMWRRGVFFAEMICFATLVMALLTNQ